MADNQAKIEMTAEEQGVLRTLQTIERGFEKMTRRVEKLDSSIGKSKKSGDQMFGAALKHTQAFIGAVGGVSTALGAASAVAAQLNREIENIRSRQKDSATENVSFETALSQAVRNSVGIFTAEEVRTKSLEMAQRTGVTPARAASTIGSSVTSTGVTNRQEADLAIQAAEDALRFAPELDASGVEAISGISASLAKRFQVAPSAAIGFIQRVGGQANIRETAPLIENLAPVIANLTQFGFSPTESGALASTITQGTGDVTGELSGTAAVNLADSLAKMVEAVPGRFGGLSVNEAGTIVDQAGTAAAGQALQILTNDPELKKVFFQGGTIDDVTVSAANLGKGKAKPTLRGILTAGSVENRQFIGSQQAIGGFAEGQQTYDDLLSEIASVTPISQLQRAFTAGVSQMRILDQAGGRTSISREGLAEALKAAGASDLEQGLSSIVFEGSAGMREVDPEGEVIRQLRNKATSLRTDRETQFIEGGTGQIAIPARQATEQEKRMAAALDTIATLIQQQLDDQRRRDPPQGNRQPPAAGLGRRN